MNIQRIVGVIVCFLVTGWLTGCRCGAPEVEGDSSAGGPTAGEVTDDEAAAGAIDEQSGVSPEVQALIAGGDANSIAADLEKRAGQLRELAIVPRICKDRERQVAHFAGVLVPGAIVQENRAPHACLASRCHSAFVYFRHVLDQGQRVEVLFVFDAHGFRDWYGRLRHLRLSSTNENRMPVCVLHGNNLRLRGAIVLLFRVLRKDDLGHAKDVAGLELALQHL